MFSAKISATALGNDALVMAMDGTIDQVSVGVNPVKFSYDEAGTMIIEEASWQELSLVPVGAFGDLANIMRSSRVQLIRNWNETVGSGRRIHERGAMYTFSMSSPFHISLYIFNGIEPMTEAIRSRARLIVGTLIAWLRASPSR